jgi:hypothetical protein
MKTKIESYKIGIDLAAGEDETIYAIFRKIMDKLTLIYWKRIPNDQKKKISIT